jgi:hypothetical protein
VTRPRAFERRSWSRQVLMAIRADPVLLAERCRTSVTE